MIWRDTADSRGAIVCSLVHGWDLHAIYHGMADPLKTLLTLDHFDDQLSLNHLVVLDDVRLKLLVAATDLSNDVIGLLLEMDLIDTHEIEAALDVDDWNRDIQLFDELLDLNVNFVVLSVVESDWWFVEQDVALLLNLSIGNPCVLSLRDDEMLVVCIFIDLLLFDSSNHFFLFHVEVSQICQELDFLVVLDLEQSLSLLLLKSSSFSNLFILLIFHSVGLVSLVSEVILSSLPESLFLLLSDDVESSSLCLDDELVLLHHDVVELGLGSSNALHVWCRSGAARVHHLFDFARVEPHL